MLSALVRCSASQRNNAVVRQCVYMTHCTTCRYDEVGTVDAHRTQSWVRWSGEAVCR